MRDQCRITPTVAMPVRQESFLYRGTAPPNTKSPDMRRAFFILSVHLHLRSGTTVTTVKRGAINLRDLRDKCRRTFVAPSATPFQFRFVGSQLQMMSSLTAHGIPHEVAEQAACALIDSIIDEWGGLYVTIPKDMSWRLSMRDLQIYDEFNGRNHAFLAKKNNLTVRTIYEIIRRARRRGAPNQPTLL